MISSRIAANTLSDHYRCPDGFVRIGVIDNGGMSDAGYFRFGDRATCYGALASGRVCASPDGHLWDALSSAEMRSGVLTLPFDPEQVVRNLTRERYVLQRAPTLLHSLYYMVRPHMPVAVRKHLQRTYLRGWDRIAFPRWPVDVTVEDFREELLRAALNEGVESVPFIWFWPEGYSSCAMVTHDVETESGRAFCSELMDIDDSFGIKSSFQVVPEKRYSVTPSFLDSLTRRGFEVNIHGLDHEGNLFETREHFLERVEQINKYAARYGARGFRSPVLYRNPDWFESLEFSYDMSFPNVGHLDPQRGGCCTVFPYFIGHVLELPLTTVQDYSLFHYLRRYSTEIWEQQIEQISDKHGLISLLIHPDYILHRREQDVYSSLLSEIARRRDRGDVWVALPGEVNQWWRARNSMELHYESGTWIIEGPQHHRARLAFAELVEGRTHYRVMPASGFAHKVAKERFG